MPLEVSRVFQEQQLEIIKVWQLMENQQWHSDYSTVELSPFWVEEKLFSFAPDIPKSSIFARDYGKAQ